MSFFHACLLIVLTLVSLPLTATETCPDFSGTWRFDDSDPDCGTHESSGERTFVQIPAIGGYYLPQPPVIVSIHQQGCSSLRFRIEKHSVPPDGSLDFRGAESLFELKPAKRREVAWTESTLTVRYRIKDRTARILPGFGRKWAEWSLATLDPDRVQYSYSITEKGAALFVFPFKDEQRFVCSMTRIK